MRSFVLCETTDSGIHSFYLISGGQRYFLFTQRFRKGVHDYYKDGVCLDDAIDFSRARRNTAVEMTMNKLPLYIKYIEKEYSIEVLKQTKRRSGWNKALSARKCA